MTSNQTMESQEDNRHVFLPSKLQVFQLQPPTSSCIGTSFVCAEDYIQACKRSVIKRMNIQIWNKMQHYHNLIENADVSNYLKRKSGVCDVTNVHILPEEEVYIEDEDESCFDPPCCLHDRPCKVSRVRKQGPNIGRYFFSCSLPRNRRCKFFEWAIIQRPTTKTSSTPSKVKLNNARAICSYFKRNDVVFMVDCTLIRSPSGDGLKSDEEEFVLDLSSSLSHKEIIGHVWILSPSFSFDPEQSLIVTVHVVTSRNRVIVRSPASFPSEWGKKVKVHVLQACDVIVEIKLVDELSGKLNELPLLCSLIGSNKSQLQAGFKQSSIFNLSRTSQPVISTNHEPVATINLPHHDMMIVAQQYADEYKLSANQCSILYHVVDMFKGYDRSKSPILLIDGVLGSGKTLVLSLAVMLLHELINTASANVEHSEDPTRKNWKVMVTGNSDAQIDALLSSLLGLGFDRIARVGDFDVIKSSLLPYSVQCKGGSNERIKKLNALLRQNGRTKHDIQFIEKALSQAHSAATKRLLHRAFVVGVRCRDCFSPSICYYNFPVVLIDGACSINETLSLLPITKFSCEKLLLAGDYNFYKSTNHNRDSLFARLILSGSTPIQLRSTYRCNATVMSLINHVIYSDESLQRREDEAQDNYGLPRCCLYDVLGCVEGKYFNREEALFVCQIILFLLNKKVPGSSITVITTYDVQVDVIMKELQNIELVDRSDVDCVTIVTHKRFHYDEKKIVIFSPVGVFPSSDEHWWNDVIRLLTYGECHVIIAGNINNLYVNNTWRRAIEYLRSLDDGVQTVFHFRNLMKKQTWSRYRVTDVDSPFVPTLSVERPHNGVEDDNDDKKENNEDIDFKKSDDWCESPGSCDDINDDHDGLDDNTDNSRDYDEDNCDENDETNVKSFPASIRHKRKHFVIDDDSSD